MHAHISALINTHAHTYTQKQEALPLLSVVHIRYCDVYHITAASSTYVLRATNAHCDFRLGSMGTSTEKQTPDFLSVLSGKITGACVYVCLYVSVCLCLRVCVCP